MKFGPTAVSDAEGAVLAHSVSVGGVRLRKARLLTAQDIATLLDGGISEIIAARLDADDVDENEAATRIAAALDVSGIEVRAASTGRVNFHAKAGGIFTVAAEPVYAINAIDESITLATLPNHASVEVGQMVATVKIIPFAIASQLVDDATKIAATGAAMKVHPFRPLHVALIQTMLPGIKPSVLDKTAAITAARLARTGSTLIGETRVSHEKEEVARAITHQVGGADMVVVFGASAVSDPDDVIPAAIRAAGGSVERVGMPVDPGNLLVLGRLGAKPVMGAPGCARSPKLNGFDWVLDRLISGLDVTSRDIASMGVGGLLMEIPTRPQPREPLPKRTPKLGAVLLAAGRSSRMGGPNKLLAELGGVPLIRRMTQRLAACAAAHKVVVLGSRAEALAAVIEDLPVDTVKNPGFASGLASSLKTGIRALPADMDGALVALADMPEVTTADLDRLISAFTRHGGMAVVRASAGGVRGNPVILPRALLARIDELQGDTGARHLIETGGLEIVDIDIGEAARTDVDTPETLRAAGGVLRG